MNFETDLSFPPRRTLNGLILLLIGLSMGALASTAAMPYNLDNNALERVISGEALPMWMSILNCLSPIGLMLSIMGLLVIAGESKQFDRRHERFAWSGAVLYLVSIVINFTVSIPVSFALNAQGSLSLAIASAWVLAAISAVGSLGLALALFPYASLGLGRAIFAITALLIAASLGLTAVSVSGGQMVEMTILNQTSHIFQPAKGGAYPALAITGMVLNWVFDLIVLYLVVRYARLSREILADTVV